jgi:hypothetical protein
MDTFRITSVTDGDYLEFHGTIPRNLSGYDGTGFRVSWNSSALNATVDVYDIQPHTWSKLFRDLADNWRGWSGTKEHKSLEGHLRLSCRIDSTGHVKLRVSLRGGDLFASDWQTEATLELEAGQLEGLAQEARKFFG